MESGEERMEMEACAEAGRTHRDILNGGRKWNRLERGENGERVAFW